MKENGDDFIPLGHFKLFQIEEDATDAITKFSKMLTENPRNMHLVEKLKNFIAIQFERYQDHDPQTSQEAYEKLDKIKILMQALCKALPRYDDQKKDCPIHAIYRSIFTRIEDLQDSHNYSDSCSIS